MANLKTHQESHIRSILKGISWRIIAFADTFLVTLIITYALTGTPEVKAGFTIAGIEFFLKLAIYYVHERIWQFARKDGEVTKLETLYKTISWRVVATSTTFLIALVVLGGGEDGSLPKNIALGIAITETITKFIMYYGHERLWYNLPLGAIRSFLFKKK